MKSTLTLALIAIISIGLTACGSKEEKQPEPAQQKLETPKARPDQHPDQPGSMGKATKGSW